MIKYTSIHMYIIKYKMKWKKNPHHLYLYQSDYVMISTPLTYSINSYSITYRHDYYCFLYNIPLSHVMDIHIQAHSIKPQYHLQGLQTLITTF